MRKLIAIPVIALLFAACGGGSGLNKEAVEAAVSTMSAEETDTFCEAMDLYSPAGFFRILSEAYDEGKPDGIIWIRVNHSPNKEDLAYMVDLLAPRCGY